MVESLYILEQEYCPPLDPALVHAIYFDFADAADGIQLAKDLLEGLKQSAIAEQLTDFDPSGSSGGAVRGSPSKQGVEDVDSNAETWASQTTVTDYTSPSNDLSTLSLGETSSAGSEESDGGYFKDTEHFETPTKELLLVETFPTLRRELVSYTLKKCDGDFSKATDELLNHVYFENTRSSPTEETVIAKGIDAFSEENHVPKRGKKGKAKKKPKGPPLYPSSPASTSDPDLTPTSTTNKWLDGNRDIDFIVTRTNLSHKAVASLYHENGASLPATVLTLVAKNVAAHAREESDATLIQSALDVVEDFPNVDLEHALALVRLTAPSTANAHEFAKALTSQTGPFSAKGGIQVIPQYAPVRLADPVSETSKVPSLPPSAKAQDSTSLVAARGKAFTQASAAYRKGRSTPLMKAAAGYYSQVGRDLSANLKVMNEAEADALVSSQSSSAVLDLHGVSVSSATRIAKERTQAWWDGLGEQRIPGGGRRGVGDGYRIITGLGRHSEGGRGKIGPAVVKAMVKEGWKVEVGTGELVVAGLARRK